MLSIIREHADSWMIKAILWLIIFAFVGTIFYSWGMGGSASSGGGVIATVNGQKILQVECFCRINWIWIKKENR